MRSKIYTWCVFSFFLLINNSAWSAPQDAVQQIRDHAVKIFTLILKDNGKNSHFIRNQVEDYILPSLDFNRMTALAVGVEWKNTTEKQRNELIREFKKLLINSYSGSMLQFKNSKIIIYNKPYLKKEGKEVLVKTDIILPSEEKIFVNYRLYFSDGQYKIYNISINGASLVTMYRSSFNDVVKQVGIDGLINHITRMNASLE